jgi:hypothetical protein
VNTYRTTFFAQCPVNSVRIKYDLQIATRSVIAVERILEFIAGLQSGFHEAFADQLLQQFGGQQTLTADHHGVTIETNRSIE